MSRRWRCSCSAFSWRTSYFRSWARQRTVWSMSNSRTRPQPKPTWTSHSPKLRRIRPRRQRIWKLRASRGGVGGLRNGLSHPDLLFYQLKSTAYKYSFMLIPISLPFLWLMFAWRRGVRVYDHAIFSLYSLSFMSLLFTLLALISAAGLPSVVAPAIMIVPPVHMFMQLRETYALSIFSALWRTLVLLSICGTAFLLFLA